MGSIPGLDKPKSMKLIFAASPLSTRHKGARVKTGCHGIRITCQSDCCFSELAL